MLNLKTPLRTVTVLILGLTAAVACTPKSSSPDASPSDTSYNLKPEVSKTAPPEIQSLAADLRAGKSISFNRITDLLEKRHGDKMDPSKGTTAIRQFLASILPSNAGGLANGRLLKVAYEDKIKSLNGGSDLIYNRSAVNVLNIARDHKMQCYSGTYLFELLRRQLGGARFRQGQEVVIFQNGHVLPGYFETAPDGKSRALIGIETTQSGGGGQVVTWLSDYNKSIGQNRVVDAELWALVELTQDYLTNGPEIMKAALEQTAKKYNFTLEELTTPSSSGGVSAVELLNASLFGFGQANVPDGDLQRTGSGDDGKNSLAAPAVAVMAPPQQDLDLANPDLAFIKVNPSEILKLNGDMARAWNRQISKLSADITDSVTFPPELRDILDRLMDDNLAPRPEGLGKHVRILSCIQEGLNDLDCEGFTLSRPKVTANVGSGCGLHLTVSSVFLQSLSVERKVTLTEPLKKDCEEAPGIQTRPRPVPF